MIFNGPLSFKMVWVQTFFTKLEIVSPDGRVVLGNFMAKFFPAWFVWISFHVAVINERHNRAQYRASATLDSATLTASLMSPNGWPSIYWGSPSIWRHAVPRRPRPCLISLHSEHHVATYFVVGYEINQLKIFPPHQIGIVITI